VVKLAVQREQPFGFRLDSRTVETEPASETHVANVS
jgi:hypothetical protein